MVMSYVEKGNIYSCYPPKIKRHKKLQNMGFPVKPTVYGDLNLKRRKSFIHSLTDLLSEFPVTMIRVATSEDDFDTPWRYGLKSEEEIETAYDELRDIIIGAGYNNPWLMGENFYPRENLFAADLRYIGIDGLTIPSGYDPFYDNPQFWATWNSGHQETSKGNISPSKINARASAFCPGLSVSNPEDVSIPNNILRFALRYYRPYYTYMRGFIEELMRGRRGLILETITQFPVDVELNDEEIFKLDKTRHFVLEYTPE